MRRRRIDVYVHGNPDTLARIEQQLDRLLEQEQQMALDLTELTAAVQANTDATSSATQVITALADELHNSADDPAAVHELADQIQQNADALAAAVQANTDPGQPPDPDA